MRQLYVLWIEDSQNYIDSFLFNLVPDLRNINIDFGTPDIHHSAENIDSISRAINVDLVLVDYNLPGGVNGDEVIIKICSHAHNSNIPIIFYSSNINAVELQALVSSFQNVICVHRDSLGDEIIRLFQ